MIYTRFLFAGMGSELLRSGMQGFGYSPGRKESSKAQTFNIIHSTQLIFTTGMRAGVCPVLFHVMFASLVQVEGLCWTRFRKLPKWLPVLSYLQQSILASVSMTTTTTLWWHPLLRWRWQCQHVPTASNPTATEVSHALILKAGQVHVKNIKELTISPPRSISQVPRAGWWRLGGKGQWAQLIPGDRRGQPDLTGRKQ